MSPILLSLIVVLVANLPHAQSSVCSRRCKTSYKTKCGLFDWGRCTAYRYKTCYRCCSGWSGSTSSGCSTPICYSCWNGGTCTSPNYCSNCNRGYYSPSCSRCRSIANCEDVYCSSYSNQRCGRCEGDYGPGSGSAYRRSYDDRSCIKQCSWRSGSNACYPGHCTDGQCTCSTGFSGQDCRTMESSRAPVISDHRAFLIMGNMSLESPVFQNSTDTVYTDVINFTRIQVVWKVSYQPSNLPPHPPYVRSVSLGIMHAGTSVSVRTAGGSVINIGRTRTCYSSEDTPRTGLLACEYAEDMNYTTWTPSTGDVITYDVTATSGGKLDLYNRDSSNIIITRYYNRASASASSSFTFALSGATHCTRGSYCRTTMLNVGENVISEPGITVTWDGWTDTHAGIKEYSLDVRQLSGTVGDEMTEILDTPAVYQGVSESGLNITLPQPGVYSFVLSVIDNLDNVRRCRRFVFLDSNPDDLSIRAESPMRVQVQQGAWETRGAWLNDINPVDNTSLLLNWAGHFINEMHHSQGLLKPIGTYDNGIIDADYDQNFGTRNRTAVANALGVKNFRVFSDIDHSGGKTIANASVNQSLLWQHVGVTTQVSLRKWLVDGDSIRFWVEARDIAGHFIRDSILVHVDSSPPVIQDTKIAITEFTISVHFRTFDEHSGIKAINWWLFDNETDAVVASGYKIVVPLNVTENITTCYPPACLCTPLGDCYATAQHFKPLLPAGMEEHSVFITFSVTNKAGLARNDTIESILTVENVGIFSKALERDTNDTSSVDEKNVVSIANLLGRIVNIENTTTEVTLNIVNTVSNLLLIDDSELGDTKMVARSFSRITKSLCRQLSNVLSTGVNVSYVTASLAVRAMTFYPWELTEGIGFAAVGLDNSTDSMTGSRVYVYGPHSEVTMEQVVASVELPSEIADRLTGADTIPVTFIVYQSSKLFRSQLTNAGLSSGISKFIDSRVVDASVDCVQITDLSDDAPVVTAFLQNKMMQSDDPELQTVECVFWDFGLRDGIGEWSTEGCRRRPSVAGRTVCNCNHTTNFAVLVTIQNQVPSFVLDAISKVGCSISVVALIITIIVYSVIGSLRVLEASRILISFCFSLLLLHLVFLAGVENTSTRAGCIAAAVLMHYFVLTSMAWMGVEAVNMYFKLVKVSNAVVQHFMIKASIVAWGLPLFVVVIILAVDYTVYDNQDSCLLKAGPSFYVGELLPMVLVILFSLFVFVFIVRKLMSSASNINDASNESKRAMISRRLKTMISVSVLLWLTLAFGLLSVVGAGVIAFQVFFFIFNFLQGLLIFILFVVRQEKVREGVGNLVQCRQEETTESSGKTREPSVGFRNDGVNLEEADVHAGEGCDNIYSTPTMARSKGGINNQGQGGASQNESHEVADDQLGSEETRDGTSQNAASSSANDLGIDGPSGLQS